MYTDYIHINEVSDYKTYQGDCVPGTWNAFQNGQLNYHKVTYIWPWKFMNLLWILIIFLTWIFKPTNFPDTEIKVMYTLQRRKKDMPLPFSSLNPHPHPFKSVLWCP